MKEKELPEGWELFNLGQLEDEQEISFQNGFACGINNQMGVGVPQLRPMNIDLSGQITLNQLKFIETDRDITNYFLQPGDVIFNNTNSAELVGKTAVWSGSSNEYVLSNHMTIIRIKNMSKLNPNFIAIYFLILWKKRYFENICREHINQASIGLERLREIDVPIPPLPTQRQIVAILEQAEAMKRLRVESNELTQRLLQSVFYEMFGDPVKNEKGWDVVELEKLSSLIIDCPHSTPQYEDTATVFPCIRTTELKDGYIDWTQMKYLNEERYIERTRRLTPKEGDIVFGREGSFGVAVRIPKNIKLCLGQRVMLFRPDEKYCNSEFLWTLLNSEAILKQANRKTSGSTVDHINVKDIKNFKGICPPLLLQQEFARIVEQVEALREHQRQSAGKINLLFEGLMQKAFSGELVT